MLSTYLNILGVSPNATETELKKAYREKAKIYHPDINKSPDANEKFALLTEAYEYMLMYIRNPQSAKLKHYTSANWTEDARQKAREQARAAAQMRYKEFINSEYYKTISETLKFADFFLFLFLLLIFGFLIYSTYNKDNLTGSIILISFTLFIFSAYVKSLLKGPKLTKKSILRSSRILLESNAVKVLLLIIVNVVFFFGYTIYAIIPDIELLVFLIISMVMVTVYTYIKSSTYKKRRLIFIIGISPALVGLFLFINTLFPKNTSEEIHFFKFFTETYQKGYINNPSSTLVELENDKYHNCTFVRLFKDYDKLAHSSGVKFKTSSGLFGIKFIESVSYISHEEFYQMERASQIQQKKESQ